MAQEQDRINYLIRRDGYAEARRWVERTLYIYREAVISSSSHASLPEYRPRFEQAIAAFQTWLSAPAPRRGRPPPA